MTKNSKRIPINIQNNIDCKIKDLSLEIFCQNGNASDIIAPITIGSTTKKAITTNKINKASTPSDEHLGLAIR